MRNGVLTREALLAVSPTALSIYARAAGWKQHDTYRVHSNIYIGEGRPEIIVPRTDHLGDYASVVADLIKKFAEVGRQDEINVCIHSWRRTAMSSACASERAKRVA